MPSGGLSTSRCAQCGQKKWGPALLPTPNAPSEGSAKPQVQVPGEPDPEFRLTSSGVASHLTASSRRRNRWPYRGAWPEGSLPFRPIRPVIGPKSSAGAIRCSTALLGMILSCVPLRSPAIRRSPRAASRSRKIISSGASSRLATKAPRGTSTACRGDRILGSPAASSCRCRHSDEAGTAVPITGRQ